MKCVDDFRLTFGKRELVPIVIGGMGVDISTSDLSLVAAASISTCSPRRRAPTSNAP